MVLFRSLTLLIIVLFASSAAAQPIIIPTNTPPLPPFVAIFGNDLRLFNDANDTAAQVSVEGMQRGTGNGRVGVIDTLFAISPDTSKIVYAALSGTTNETGASLAQLMLYDASTGERTLLNVTLTATSQMRMAISMDSQTLFYNDGLTFYRLPLTVGAQPTPLFSLPPMSGGGGGGSSYPPDPLFWTERNGHVSNTVPILAETPLGLLFTPPPPISSYDNGVYLYDFTQGQAFVIHDLITSAALSPDRSEIVGLVPPQGERPGHPDTRIVRVNLQSRAVETLSTGSTDLVTWGASGSNAIFYSTRIRRGDVNLDFVPADVRTVLFGASGAYADGTPVGVPRYDVAIFRYDLVSGETTQLHQADAWAIGRMAATPDGSTLVFTQITGLQRWVSEMAARLNFPEPYSPAQTELYRLDLVNDSGALELVGVNIQRPTFAHGS